MRLSIFIFMLFLGLSLQAQSENKFEKDTIKTAGADLEITFIGHGTLMFQFNGKVIHVDPVGEYADYAQLPKADLILVTHEHGDHLDPDAISILKKDDTEIILTGTCRKQLGWGTVMANNETRTAKGFRIESVPAYNLVHKRSNGQPFHPKGQGNGYIIAFADQRVYIAGDTENTPEMKKLTDIDIAFLPMNLPYTMTPDMVADAARAFRPRILYPYHFGNTDTGQIIKLLANEKDIEVRIRKLN
ncbi:MAG: MBL fold metallo-hydrolase [Candidatus Zhuqueibacterota bacterium]